MRRDEHFVIGRDQYTNMVGSFILDKGPRPLAARSVFTRVGAANVIHVGARSPTTGSKTAVFIALKFSRLIGHDISRESSR